MTALRLGVHNQGDTAPTPATGWDVQCLTERSSKPLPKRVERHTSRRLKGLAIDWDPDVLDVKHAGSAMAHVGLAKVTPNRGTIWVEGALVEAPWVKVAVVCSHRLNDPDGSARLFGPMRRLLWKVHAAQDRRIFERLERRGFYVTFGGDVNDRSCGLVPLERAKQTRGHYDAIGYTDRAKARGPVPVVEIGAKNGSDHNRFTATFNFKEKS